MWFLVAPGVYLHFNNQSKISSAPIWVLKTHSAKQFLWFLRRPRLHESFWKPNTNFRVQSTLCAFWFSRWVFWFSRLALKMLSCLKNYRQITKCLVIFYFLTLLWIILVRPCKIPVNDKKQTHFLKLYNTRKNMARSGNNNKVDICLSIVKKTLQKTQKIAKKFLKNSLSSKIVQLEIISMDGIRCVPRFLLLCRPGYIELHLGYFGGTMRVHWGYFEGILGVLWDTLRGN